MLSTAALLGVLGYGGWRMIQTNPDAPKDLAGGSAQSATEVAGAG